MRCSNIPQAQLDYVPACCNPWTRRLALNGCPSLLAQELMAEGRPSFANKSHNTSAHHLQAYPRRPVSHIVR
eukprot:CAMPEP_0172729804 /NCGR_PEP_ID=MMETSP1074-20121228/95929_1 /TAXON_ID=2916 /ORGANISM="Ceratium fusus, Strain PA161109" /LENGTH=71 /DNA_ID=CAMNT_0013557367 /DNA_START=175 /DNA_END=386 /DNA_ORIENTATION=+